MCVSDSMRPLAPISPREFKSSPMDEIESEGIIENGNYDSKLDRHADDDQVEQNDNENIHAQDDTNNDEVDIENGEIGYSSPVRSIYPRAKTHVIHRSQSFGDLNAPGSPHSQYARKKLSSTSFKEDLLFVNGHLSEKGTLRTSAGSSPLSPSALEPIQVTWGRKDSVQLVSVYSPPPKTDMYSQLLQNSAEKVLNKIKTRQQTLLSDVTPQHRASGDATKTVRLTPLIPLRRKLQPLKAETRSVSAKNDIQTDDGDNPTENAT